jgi:HD-GYP domain-containing protein (c-di-GMP phosphodiesterase class II)
MQIARGRGSRLGGSGGALLLLAALLVPVAVFALLRGVPGLDLVFQSPIFHVVVVSLIAACALQVAVMAAVAAARARQPSIVLLALGCLCVGLFMLAHGLVTPGVADRPANLWVARFPLLAILSFSVCVAASPTRPNRAAMRLVGRAPRAALAGPGLLIAGLCLVLVISPASAFGEQELPGEEAVRAVLTPLITALLAATAVVYWRRWRLSRDPVQFALVAASVLAAEALLSIELGRLWHLSWWDYHVLLLVGFGAAVYAVVVGYRRTRTLEGVLGGLLATSTLDQISRSYPDALRALVAAVEARDGYTHGHSARVAAMAVRMGQQMGLRPEILRRLAQGALLHDIGKIGVPDEILNKPGRLTEPERGWIERHPVIGWDIVRRAPSLRDALVPIRHHHERVDGAGYPDRLAGPDIPLEARIVAVADVWDALTSDRAYRPAWERTRAIDQMARARGSHFDPDCLDAFLSVMEREGLRPSGEDASSENIDAAAEACHHVMGTTNPAGAKTSRS